MFGFFAAMLLPKIWRKMKKSNAILCLQIISPLCVTLLACRIFWCLRCITTQLSQDLTLGCLRVHLITQGAPTHLYPVPCTLNLLPSYVAQHTTCCQYPSTGCAVYTSLWNRHMFPIMLWQIRAVSAGTWVLRKIILISIRSDWLDKMDIKVVTFASSLQINITLTLVVFEYSS